jgi:tetratricopeptide (TPR) repeat protein
LQRAQLLLETGQKLRQQKNYSQARLNLVAILESDAPDDLQRRALVELALMAQEQGEPARAQQIFAQFIRNYHDDPSVPEILLRQGLLYREMGAPSLALVKFYAVMTSSLSSKAGSVDQYQRLVLQAQTEIADTYFLQGKHEEASEFYARLLKLDSADLNKALIQYKLVRCLAALSRNPETVAQAKDFLTRYPAAPQQPEVRFLLSIGLKKMGQREEAVQQVLALLKSQQNAGRRGDWVYWQQRAGNEIGNQFYEESNFLSALDVYTALAALDESPAWQLPVWYQIGIVYERLQQPRKAIEAYARIIAREKEPGPNVSPGIKTVLDMAKWRANFLGWQTQAAAFSASEARPDSSISR